MAEIQLTRTDLEEFVKMKVWKYFISYMVDRTDKLMGENNHADPFKDPTAICRNQGLIAGLGEIIDLPAILAEQIDFDSKTKKKEDKKDGE